MYYSPNIKSFFQSQGKRMTKRPLTASSDTQPFLLCYCHATMESTDIYWMPIYEILDGAFSGDITFLPYFVAGYLMAILSLKKS